jgi:hypothetical protein
MKTNELNHKLYLYKPSGEDSDFLGELLVDNLNVDIKLHDISSISFNIPRVINGVPNPRIDQVLDNYIVELHYGRITESYPNDYFKMRFVIYTTPMEFSDSKFIHSYQGSSTESLLEFKLLDNWQGVEVYDFFRTISYNRASNNFIEGSLVATLATGTNVVTLTTGTTSGLIAGQILTKISGDGVFGTGATVGAITNATQFTVVNSSGTALNHATLGAITFSATTYVNQESNATTKQRYIRLEPVKPNGQYAIYPLDIFLYEIRKKTVSGQEAETKNALIEFNFAGKDYTNADFKVGYYYLTLNQNGTVQYIYIALPDDTSTYKTATDNYLYNTFTTGYTFEYRLYDNPITKTYAIGPNTNSQENPLNDMYIDLATEADLGDLTPEYGTPEISYNSQKIYSKNGLTLRQILTGKTLESATTANRDGLLYDTEYTIGVIHEDIEDLYRSNLQFNNITRLQAIKQVAESFKAMIVFDTIAKTMSFYPENAYGANKGLILRYASYLKSLNKEVDSSKIITLATAIGKDKTSIALINPTGKQYWEDYAYFLDSYYINTDDNDILDLIDAANITLTIENKTLKTDSRIDTSITHSALKIRYTGSTAGFTNRWFSTTAQAKSLGEWQFARDLYHQVLLGNINPTTSLPEALKVPLQRYYNLYQTRDNEIKDYVKKETQLAGYEAAMYKAKYLYEYYKKEWDELTPTQQTTARTNLSTLWTRYDKYNNEFRNKTTIVDNYRRDILNPITAQLFGTRELPYGSVDSTFRKLLEVQSALHRQSTETEVISSTTYTTSFYAINPIESLNDFKRNAVNNDSSIDNELELLKSTKIYLDENKYPKITVNLDTTSLISAEEARQDWNKSFVGDKLYVFLPELNVDLEVQVREVSIDFEGNSMSLTISNVRNYNRTFGRFLTKIVRNLYNSNQNITSFYQDQYNQGSAQANINNIKRKQGDPLNETNKLFTGAQDQETGNSSGTLTGAGFEQSSVASVDEAIQTFTLVDKAEKGLSQVDGSLVAYYDRGAGGIRTEVEISGDTGIVIKRIDNDTNITDKQMYIDTSGNAVFGGQLIVGGQPTPIDVFRSQILVGVAYSIEDLQNQIDGVINTWFGDEDPTLLNYPTEGWNPTEYNQYVGDLFYNTQSGEAFRFVYTENFPEDPTDYSWVVIADNDVTLALSNAAAAQATADSKVTIFYAANQEALDDITPPSGSGAQLAEDGDMVIIATNFTHSVTSIAYKQFDTFRWDDTSDLWVKTQNIYDKAEGSVGGWTVGGTSISSNNYSYTSGNFSTAGLQLNNNGSIIGKNFAIDSSGNSYFRGDLTASSGTFGATNAGHAILGDANNPLQIKNSTTSLMNLTSAGVLTVAGFTASGSAFYTGTKSTFASNNAGVYLASDGIALGTNSPFKVTSAGVLTASSGTVGGFTLSSNTLTAGTTSGNFVGMSPNAGTGSNISFWAGALRDSTNPPTAAQISAAPFRVTNTGALTATNANITGTIVSNSGTIGSYNINPNSINSRLISKAAFENDESSTGDSYNGWVRSGTWVRSTAKSYTGSASMSRLMNSSTSSSLTYTFLKPQTSNVQLRFAYQFADFSSSSISFFVQKNNNSPVSIIVGNSVAVNTWNIFNATILHSGSDINTIRISTSSSTGGGGPFPTLFIDEIELFEGSSIPNNYVNLSGAGLYLPDVSLDKFGIIANAGKIGKFNILPNVLNFEDLTISGLTTYASVILTDNATIRSSGQWDNFAAMGDNQFLTVIEKQGIGVYRGRGGSVGGLAITSDKNISYLYTTSNSTLDIIANSIYLKPRTGGGAFITRPSDGVNFFISTGSGGNLSSKIIKKNIEAIQETDIYNFIDRVQVKKYFNLLNNVEEISIIIEDEEKNNNPFINIITEKGLSVSFNNTLPDYLKQYEKDKDVIEVFEQGENKIYNASIKSLKIKEYIGATLAAAKLNHNRIKELEEENQKLKDEIALIKQHLGI